MRVHDAEIDSEQLQLAVNILRAHGLPVGFTDSGYFIVATDEDVRQCVEYCEQEIRQQRTRIQRMKRWWALTEGAANRGFFPAENEKGFFVPQTEEELQSCIAFSERQVEQNRCTIERLKNWRRRH